MNALYYQMTDTGSEEPRETLVLLGGYTSDMQLWRPLMKEIKSTNVSMHILTIDNLGAGRSPQPRELYTTREMAKSVCACLDKLDIVNAIVLGHSMGSAIAQHIALCCPKRVRRLFLVSSFAKLDTVAARFLQARYELMAAHVEKALVAKASMPSLFGNRFLENEDNVALGIQRVIENPQTPDGMKGQLNACITHNTLKSISDIQCDTTIIVGTRDVLIHPEHSTVLHERIPGSELISLEDYGHMLPLECPEKLCRHLVSSDTRIPELTYID